jgi:hypothetical protein
MKRILALTSTVAVTTTHKLQWWRQRKVHKTRQPHYICMHTMTKQLQSLDHDENLHPKTYKWIEQ